MSAQPNTVISRPDGLPAVNSLALIDQAAGTFELADPHTAHLLVDDLAPHRGDGIFETVLVTLDAAGSVTVHSREPHFTRFQASAEMLELPEPDQALFDRALEAVMAAFISDNPGITGFSVRYAMTRGVEGTSGKPTAWALTIPIDPKYNKQREAGIRVLTLDRGYEAYFGQKAPWQLIGAKTLSYATNQAAGRYVHANDADEALFVSHDGLALEGPTCNLIVKRGNTLSTPEPRAGLLHGTTQRVVFRGAEAAGYTVEYADIPASELKTADALWMVSSVRTAVPIKSVDGAPIPVDEPLTQQLIDWVLQGE
ncbi:aminotransferase class IV [Brevibacterium sp. 50QC2O2]|uniref:aminotransferase class IV n=1 Tax=Brevibacterium TaxID=1696 RepID=UPI00211C7A81|nr:MULTISPECIES: aminotransferase class IV [unclassified Brevibacterium]MCQ9369298.1 aminotransferase class IV [Brevibacterium sp. 91QC2O2]MCQ9386680.1 aminotransferase class IV [Brevibacterium sp. 68QC2CO]MCQ9388693.1 aminotransferase class IV [Brevibacterium sp. 50QC2O2]